MENIIAIIMVVAVLSGVICLEPEFCDFCNFCDSCVFLSKSLLGKSCSKIKRKRDN